MTGTPSFGQAAKIGGSPPTFGSSTPQGTFGQATSPSTSAPTSGLAAFANKPSGFGAAAPASSGWLARSRSKCWRGGCASPATASSSPFAQQAQKQGGGFGQASGFGNQQQQSSGSGSGGSGFGQPSSGFGQKLDLDNLPRRVSDNLLRALAKPHLASDKQRLNFGNQQQQKPPGELRAFRQILR